jgi:hypothetical protein
MQFGRLVKETSVFNPFSPLPMLPPIFFGDGSTVCWDLIKQPPRSALNKKSGAVQSGFFSP